MSATITERASFAESVRFGERLGLYEAIAHAGPVTSEELARIAGLPEIEVRRWLRIQVDGQYVVSGAAPRHYQTWCDLPRN